MTPDQKNKLSIELCDMVAMLTWLDPGDITPATSLTAVGVDSLGRNELIAHVEVRLGRMLDEKHVPALDTVAEIVEFAEQMETQFAAASAS